MSTVNTILVFVVYSLNFLLFIGAVFTIYICLSDQRQKDIIENVDIDFEFFVLFSTILLIVAIIVALISFLGCFGIAIDNDYMLIGYVVILGILMVSKIFLCIYLSRVLSNSEDDIRKKILEMVKKYSKNAPNKMDGIQTKYSCCGIEDFRDWLGKGNESWIPGSCCRKEPHENCTPYSVYGKHGCKRIILETVSTLLNLSYRIIFVAFSVEVLLIVCCILILLDVGRSDDDNLSDEIVFVGQLKKNPFVKNENIKFEESIDTHDSHSNQPLDPQSPTAREEEMEGEEKLTADETQDEEIQEEESRIGEKYEETAIVDDKADDEIRVESTPLEGESRLDDETSDEEKQEEDDIQEEETPELESIDEGENLRRKISVKQEEEICVEGIFSKKGLAEQINVTENLQNKKRTKKLDKRKLNEKSHEK